MISIVYTCLLITVLGKGGLGREKYMKERAEEKKTWESRSLSDFRQRKQSVFSLKRVEVDIRKSQKACEQLDSAKVCYLLMTHPH